MPIKYGTESCVICGKKICNNGVAKTSHMRVHVKNGEVREIRRGKGIIFEDTKIPLVYIPPEPYAVLGEEPISPQPKDCWDITKIIRDFKSIKAEDYYITSGEGVRKAEVLVKDLYSAAVKARSLKNKLIKARGKAKYLEVCRENGRILVKRKFQRERGDSL